jgi:hypothetical protein
MSDVSCRGLLVRCLATKAAGKITRQKQVSRYLLPQSSLLMLPFRVSLSLLNIQVERTRSVSTARSLLRDRRVFK